jgi:hypothetical protein
MSGEALTPTEVLRRHAIERWLRRAVRSVVIGEGGPGVPRMSPGAWLESCALTRGVPAQLLDVLGIRECEGMGVSWVEEAREVMGEMGWHPTEQVARPLTFVRAAARLGLELEFGELRDQRLAAIATVTENLLARGRE